MKRTIALAIAGTAVILAISSRDPMKAAGAETTIKVTAKKFEYSPAQITVKKGAQVVLEISSQDAKHGFNLPDFGVRADIKPGTITRVTFTADRTGTFSFACDVFCGSGHEDMSGQLTVVE